MADQTRLYTRQPNGLVAYLDAGNGHFYSGHTPAGSDISQLQEAGFQEVSPDEFSATYGRHTAARAAAPGAPVKLAYRSAGGTTPYFQSKGGMMEESALPVDADPEELLREGYTFVNKDDFAAQRDAQNPLSDTKPSAQDAALDRIATGYSPEDVDALGAAFDASRAPAIARQNAAVDAAMRNSPRGAQEDPVEVDALAKAFDADFAPRPTPARSAAPRGPGVSVQRVPTAVGLASPLGGTPLPRPALPSAMAPQEGVATSTATPEETLADVQARADRQRALAGLARAGSRMGAALANVKPESGPADELEQSADRTVSDYLQRKQAAELEKQKAEQDALKDPTSPQSKRFQEVVARTFGGIYTPEQISHMAAADKDQIFDAGKMRATLDERAQQAKEERASRESIAAENRAARSEDARQRSLDRQLSRDLAMQQHKDTLALREGQKEDDFNRKMAERNVGGYTFDPKNPPTVDGAKQMAHITTARDEVNAGLDNLEQKINENGSEMFGATAGDMESDWMNITNRLRNLNQMGVPNGKDYEMLAKQLVDPTSMAAMFTSKDRMLQQIKTLRRQMGQTVDATAKAYKFTPTSGAAPGSSASTGTGQRVPVKRVPNKDRTKYRIDYSDGTSEVVNA